MHEVFYFAETPKPLLEEKRTTQLAKGLKNRNLTGN